MAKKPQNQTINRPLSFLFPKRNRFSPTLFLTIAVVFLESTSSIRAMGFSVYGKVFASLDISFEGVLSFTSFAFNKVQCCLPRVLKFSCYRYSTSKVNCLKISSIVLCCRLSALISWWFTPWYDLANWPKLIFHDNSKGTWQVQKHDRNHLITADNSHWVWLVPVSPICVWIRIGRFFLFKFQFKQTARASTFMQLSKCEWQCIRQQEWKFTLKVQVSSTSFDYLH